MSAIEVKQKIAQLLTQNAQHYDPVRFAYIQSLAKRIEHPMYCENVALIAKASNAIEQYESALSERRSQIQAMLDELLRRSPDKSHQANDLFEQCQFNRLEKLCKQLYKAHKDNPNLAPLSELNISLNQFSDDIQATDEDLSFEQILNLQEQEVVAMVPARKDQERVDNVDKNDFVNSPEPNDSPERKKSPEQFIELQSIKVFRESIKHVNIDRIIDRAINDEPANPGPHNPHMLAIKSLIQMRELSPQYLRRFAAYIETLLWLEKNAAKLSDTKKGL